MRNEGTRFSYANVMSTLAVFLAIAGGAYAAAKINGKTLKNQSVAGKKLKKNTITGKQVKESKLGKVPKAKQADKATTADTATTANSATTASTADNALALGGLAPDAFERSGRILFGTGQIDATSPQPLFSSNVANFGLATDGDADKFTQLQLQNNNSSGNLIGTVFTENPASATAFGIAANTAGQIGPAAGTGADSLDTLIVDAGPGNQGKAVWVHCLFNPTGGIFTTWCWGTQAS